MVFEGVLGRLHLRYNFSCKCPCISEAPEAMFAARLRALEECRVSLKSPSWIPDSNEGVAKQKKTRTIILAHNSPIYDDYQTQSAQVLALP